MNLPSKIAIIYLFIVQFHFSQVSITTSNYSQNFGTSAIATWTNNSTFAGWYINDVTEYRGAANITAAAPSNTGGVYIYTCSGGTDRKIGSRASGGTGTINYGVRFRNNTGATIRSIRVSFNAFQLSRAENNNNSNVLTFSYRAVSSPTTITDLTTGTYTNVAALNYTAPTNHPGPGTSNQVNGIPCSTSSSISSCIAVTIPNNGEIMLRWTDIDNSANDHHIAIDDVQVAFSTIQTNCTVLLPVDLENFEANCSSSKLNLKWETTSERNNDYFLLEGSKDGFSFEEIQKVKGMGNSSQLTVYSEEIENSTYEYLRLKQVDFDGVISELQTIKSPCYDDSKMEIYPNPIKDILTIDNLDIDSEVKIWDSFGKLIYCERVNLTKLLIDFNSYANGFYILEISKNSRVELEKLIKQN